MENGVPGHPGLLAMLTVEAELKQEEESAIDRSPLMEGTIVTHASLKLTKIVFPTCTSCHRTLLMCSSDKFLMLNQ